jgi:thiosulfate/3-mercaptopyruvate sulfurtransferase
MKRSRFLLHITSAAAALVLSGIQGRKLILRILAVSMLAVLTVGTSVHAADPLVDVTWVKANIGKTGVVFVDLRGTKDYQKRHVPGAVHTNYKKDGWRVNKKPVKGLMPEPAKLEKLIGSLGIDNKSHVVLLSPGKKAADMGMSARLYWTFKTLGQDEVSILDGGMKAYLADKKNPTEPGVNKPEAKIFKANLRKELLATEDDVRQALKDGTALIDNRSADKHLGINTPRSKNKRAGTLPGAKSVPGVWLTKEGGGAFRDAANVKRLYAHSGAPPNGKTISFCDTGHWASLGWFVNYEILGNKQAKMYDGSMSEWSQTSSNPMVQKVKLD